MSNKKEKEILEHIVKRNGRCEGIPDMCSMCPMAKLKKRPDGHYYSCWEVIMPRPTDLYGPEEIDSRYKKAAEDRLSQMIIEEVFLEELDEDRDS